MLHGYDIILLVLVGACFLALIAVTVDSVLENRRVNKRLEAYRKEQWYKELRNR